MMTQWLPDDPRRAPIMLRATLLAQGHTDRSIAAMVRRGVLHRVRHGSYVDAGAWDACDAVGRHVLSSRAVLERARVGVTLSHVSALAAWEIAMWEPDLTHVHLIRDDQRAGRNEAGVHQHLSSLRPIDVVWRHGLPMTSAARACLDAASLVDVEHALCSVNDALHRGLVTVEELGECAAFMEHWPGSLRHRVLLGLADERIESVGESRFWYLCWRERLPMPVPQYKVRDHTGRVVAIVDFAWPERGLFVEFDGRVKYCDPDRDEDVVGVVLREKRREELVRRLTGWRCERVIWSELSRPAQTAARVRAAFGPTSVAG